jgi:hypothetical protein
MTRRTRPGTIQSAVGAAYRAVGGLENAAADLGVSLSVLSYGTETREDRPGGLGVNYLDRLGRIDTAAALPLAQHFATLAGGVFQPVASDGSASGDIATLAAEFSDVVRQHAEAMGPASVAPGGYSRREAEAQLVEVDEMVTAALRFRAAILAQMGDPR